MVGIEYIVQVQASDNTPNEMETLQEILEQNKIVIQRKYELIPAYHVIIIDEKLVDVLKERGYIVEPSGELHTQK